MTYSRARESGMQFFGFWARDILGIPSGPGARTSSRRPAPCCAWLSSTASACFRTRVGGQLHRYLERAHSGPFPFELSAWKPPMSHVRTSWTIPQRCSPLWRSWGCSSLLVIAHAPGNSFKSIKKPTPRFKHLTFGVTMAQTSAVSDAFIEILTQQAGALFVWGSEPRVWSGTIRVYQSLSHIILPDV